MNQTNYLYLGNTMVLFSLHNRRFQRKMMVCILHVFHDVVSVCIWHFLAVSKKLKWYIYSLGRKLSPVTKRK